jgi:hypothetical protein
MLLASDSFVCLPNAGYSVLPFSHPWDCNVATLQGVLFGDFPQYHNSDARCYGGVGTLL